MYSCTVYNAHYQTLEIVCIGIMFQLPQNDVYVDSRNWKTCLLLYALRDSYKSRDKQQLYRAKTVKFLHHFFNAKDRLHSY